MESANSIRFLYEHFLSGITAKSLTSFYYACSYAKVDYLKFMSVTASMTIKLVPHDLKKQPVLLCVDDTLIPKSGSKFEDVSKLFDHAAHNGSNYLNGHCFVSLMLQSLYGGADLLAKLMHDFYVIEPEDMNFKVSANATGYYKKDKEGIQATF